MVRRTSLNHRIAGLSDAIAGKIVEGECFPLLRLSPSAAAPAGLVDLLF
jgi:hypothetical protein